MSRKLRCAVTSYLLTHCIYGTLLMLFLCILLCQTWWRHQMETFSALLALVRGIHRFTGALMFSLICVLNKHSWGGWFETPSRSLWRHCNGGSDSRHGLMTVATCRFSAKMDQFRLLIGVGASLWATHITISIFTRHGMQFKLTVYESLSCYFYSPPLSGMILPK